MHNQLSKSFIFRCSVIASCVIIGMSASGCASIMHGPGQRIGFSSIPSGAVVTVDGYTQGTTPAIYTLRRKTEHIVAMELSGYLPYETTITRSTSGWVWGNLVFGLVIGLVVDASTGSLYKLSPEQIVGHMAQVVTTESSHDDMLYIAVTLSPDPEWELVGQLDRE